MVQRGGDGICGGCAVFGIGWGLGRNWIGIGPELGWNWIGDEGIELEECLL